MAPKRRRSASTSNPNVPRINSLGLLNLDNNAKIRWERLDSGNRQILETKFACIQSLETLGLMQPIEQLLGKVGLTNFLRIGAPTYLRYTLEFLSTLDKGEDDEGPFITFHLNDEEYTMYFEEVKEAFGWDYEYDPSFNTCEGYNEGIFWAQITHGQRWNSKCKNSHIPHPALRFINRLLSATIFCHGEPTNIPRFDLKCLWTMTPQGVGCPDWVNIWVSNCIELGKKDKGKISMGGMVTVLASYLGIEVPTDEDGNRILKPLGTPDDYDHFPSYLYNLDALKRAFMLWSPPVGDSYVWLYGANNIKYMVLPQERTMITEHTTPAQLYLPPDEHYRAGVEEEYGRIVAPEPPMPQQPQDFYASMETRMASMENAQLAFGAQLNELQQQGDYMEDTMYSMSNMVSAMNNFFVSQHPSYTDPTPSIQENLERRREQRALRRANSRNH